MTTTTSRPVPSAGSAVHPLLRTLGVHNHPQVLPASTPAGTGVVPSLSPADNQPIAAIKLQSKADYESAIARAQAAQLHWRLLPAPKRGEIVRLIGNAFREYLEPLGDLVTLEAGKIRPEGKGEIQECIDIADFAVGLSRQLYGLTIQSERANHRMYEQWHPLGTIGIITAFNFPAAVWAWNAMLSAVCGNANIWKPSLLTPLTAIAVTHIAHNVMKQQMLFKPDGIDPCDIFPLIIGTDTEVGEYMIADRRLPLISATGSCRMGRHVGQVVAGRLGRSLLELGGNNAIIIMPDVDLELAVRGILFGAVGTAGQRCTTTRRIFCHSAIIEKLTQRLVTSYKSVPIGDPADAKTLMGPLINTQAVTSMRNAVERAVKEGCTVLTGGIPGIDRFAGQPGNFVEPTIIRVPKNLTMNGATGPQIAREETFAPILYVFEIDTIDQAIALQNSVDQGLSSAIFTDSVRSAERFLSVAGSDCGIANVNIGTSGAEIGGAFGGEKDTGGGRESGSDSWKAYMRRQTCTINFGVDLPLAQGIKFGD
ncbi:MAG TPA: aldehyde dehydrogenase family protein [Phycisphaerales bacterium]|nr:aldehyde dehydrogenase family protein [Phycisphaerales bacterium]